MNRKAKRLVLIYTAAALVSLSLLSAVVYSRLEDSRRASAYSARRAFEETVRAVDALSLSLEKSVYASDGGMSSGVCMETYASAQAAEAALSTLPFSTQQLEQTAAFLNTAGDYAYSLCAAVSREGFNEEQVRQLTALSASATSYAALLRELQSGVNNGLTLIDTLEQPLQNVGGDETPKLSAAMLDYEGGLAKAEPLDYDGKYCARESRGGGELSKEEAMELAAAAAGVESRALKEEYQYQGEDGRRCYSAGELLICVSSRGLESMAQSRLIGQGRITADRAAQIAADYLEKQGFTGLTESFRAEGSGLARFRFSRQQEDAVALDDYVSVSVALDDGSIYTLNALNYCGEESEVQWAVEEPQARDSLTENLEPLSVRRVIIKSAGGRDMACYEYRCAGIEGRAVTVYVDAADGSQRRIEL